MSTWIVLEAMLPVLEAMDDAGLEDLSPPEITQANNNLVLTKKTNHPNSFSLSADEFKQVLAHAQSGKPVQVKVTSTSGKPLAVLDGKDVQTSLLKMKPTLDPDMRGANYFACKIPTTAFARVRGKGPGAY